MVPSGGMLEKIPTAQSNTGGVYKIKRSQIIKPEVMNAGQDVV